MDRPNVQITPLPNAFASEVAGLDASRVDDATFDALYSAWLRYPILRLRGQRLDDAQLQAFSKRFGSLEYAPMGRISVAARDQLPNPFVATISNIVENGRPIGGLGNAEAAWHTDMSYIEDPPTASILYAVETPEEGGETHFCNMVAALAALPSALRERVRSARLKHDAAHDSVGTLRRGHRHAASPLEAPGAVHPMVRRHPENGRAALFLGRRQDAYVEGLPLAESEAFLDEVWRYVALPDAVWTQHWQVGDLLIWDNRSVMHRRAAFDAGARRLMRRTQVRPRRGDDVAPQRARRHPPTTPD
ncbi:MAG: TauD/TfdA family dioxygenase [Gammaproteobacteria bacterium]|nr:TauD/TfdA family dioxygenase [Gammaproteobacteria bacterium]